MVFVVNSILIQILHLLLPKKKQPKWTKKRQWIQLFFKSTMKPSVFTIDDEVKCFSMHFFLHWILAWCNKRLHIFTASAIYQHIFIRFKFHMLERLHKVHTRRVPLSLMRLVSLFIGYVFMFFIVKTINKTSITLHNRPLECQTIIFPSIINSVERTIFSTLLLAH